MQDEFIKNNHLFMVLRNWHENDALRRRHQETIEYFIEHFDLFSFPLACTNEEIWHNVSDQLCTIIPTNSSASALLKDHPVSFLGFSLEYKTLLRFGRNVQYLKLARGEDRCLIAYWDRRCFDNQYTIHTTSVKMIEEALIASKLWKSS